MIVIQFAIYGVLGLTYLGLALGDIPGLRMNRATIALAGSAFLIALGVLNLQEAWQAIDANTIIFLLSMMVVNANLAYGGFFRRSLSLLLSLTRSPLGLVIALTFGSGIISYLNFLQALAPVAIFGLFIQIGILWLLYRSVTHLPPSFRCVTAYA